MADEASVTSALCVVAALSILSVILAPGVREGFVVRLGLSMAAVGLFALAAQVGDGIAVHRSLWILCAGATVATFGFLLRVRKCFPAVRAGGAEHRIRP